MTTSALIQGKPIETWPTDLYVPAEALQVFLTSFEGPLDLLLYLIQHQNLNILDIPIAEITQQYLQYIDLMKELDIDLAAQYLVMAATLMEIKSRLLLPTPPQPMIPDLRTKLIQQLQEYARYKQAAQDLDALPRLKRDFFPTQVQPQIPKEILLPAIPWSAILQAMREVLERASLFTSHKIMREPLSIRERMTIILEHLKLSQPIYINNLFTIEEGRAGVIITLLAILELAKQSIIQIIQLQPFDNPKVIKK